MVLSPASSPLRKRQRLSSPTYEDEFDMLDGDDFRALDEIEYRLSQKIGSSSSPHKSFPTGNNAFPLAFGGNNPMEACDDAQYAESPSKKPKKKRPLAVPSDEQTSTPTVVPFNEHKRSSSPESPDMDYSTWFLPSASQQPAVFSSASALIGSAKDLEAGPTGSPGKKLDTRTPWILPSPAALELAQKKLQAWEHEAEDETATSEHTNVLSEPSLTYREPLKNVQNSRESQLTTTTPVALASIPSPVSRQPPLTTSLKSGLSNPLLSRTSAASSIRPPFTSSASSPVTPAKQLSQLPPTPLSLASQKPKSLGLTPRARAFTASVSRPKFVTPFKTAPNTNETGSHIVSRLPSSSNNFSSGIGTRPAQRPPGLPSSLLKEDFKNASQTNSNNKLGITRPTLATCGLVPQTYDSEELEAMGVPSSLFTLNDISDFLYYRFNPATSNTSTETTLGADTVLEELKEQGCHLSTKAWVDNHWCLILWKLSGMACLDPEKLTRIWCWKEVMRQFRYRYEKELAGSSRPPLSLITTHDTPIFRPLVLCVSRISWTPQHLGEDGRVKDAYPELELTDGWYHIRAKVDETLARAARRRIIRTGCKLICVCSKLETPRNEPIEILASYGRAYLTLCGNSTQLATWHTRLGFHRTQYTATLNSLSADGGRVPVMDLVITDVYPMAYIEFVPTPNGDARVGPRTEAEEADEDQIWKTKRTQEASRLQEALEKKLERLEGYIDLLERRSAGPSPSENDCPPPHLDSVVDELEEGDNVVSVLQNTRSEDIGWLCTLLKQKCLVEREQARQVIEAELDVLVPPRRVFSFRVLRVKDARTLKKPATRTAQLTVWDAASLQNSSNDGSENGLKAGQRYLVSNLIPSQQSAWMGTEPGAEVFLSTRKDSRWQLLSQ